jgi:hypothetical protein
MEHVVANRLADARQKATEALRERVIREEQVAAAEEKADNRFWLSVNAILIGGIVVVGLLAWLVIRSAG